MVTRCEKGCREKGVTRHALDPESAIRGVFGYYVGLLERSEETAKMIFLVLAELDQEEVRQVYLPYQERALAMIESTIQRWKEEGFVNADLDTRAASWLYFGSYLILALTKHSHETLSLDPSAAIHLARPFFSADLFGGEEE